MNVKGDSPVSSAASAIRNVLYDISTNRADSSSGKSRMWVNLVISAVQHPIDAPITSDRKNTLKKLPTERRNA